MFNINKSQDDNNPNKKIKSDWLNFSFSDRKDSLLSSFGSDNKFVQEEMKIRAMVVEILDKEFGEKIRNIKNYDFLVDSVVNKLKNKQLSSYPTIEIG